MIVGEYSFFFLSQEPLYELLLFLGEEIFQFAYGGTIIIIIIMFEYVEFFRKKKKSYRSSDAIDAIDFVYFSLFFFDETTVSVFVPVWLHRIFLHRLDFFVL